MHEFRITFGLQYRNEPHPRVKWAHPDGWLSVYAPDYETARELAVALVGSHFAFMYIEGKPNWPTQDHYPLGQLASIRYTIWD